MSKPIERFVDTARRFCWWADGDPQDSTSEARTARRLVAELCLHVMDLPEVSADADVPTIGEDQYRLVIKRFGALPFNYYSQCFNPLVVPAEEPVTAGLADDLADIWRDVKRGLILYESGATEAAVWEWRFHFSAHWGHHACGSLYALQAWFSQNDDDLE